MDSVMKNFLASGRTLITDTLAPKSELPKMPKKKIWFIKFNRSLDKNRIM